MKISLRYPANPKNAPDHARIAVALVRELGGAWVATARSPLRGVSPWPMVVALGDSEYLPAFYEIARGDVRRDP